MIKICYIKIRKKINQVFCNHRYVTYTMRGTDLEITRCMKCGKIKSLKH